jgi:photosystem II stability/assembly factor-like uncharacterized protein
MHGYGQNFWELINNPGYHIYDMTVDTEGRIYLATSNIPNGGIYRSDDNGETWIKKSNGIESTTVRAVTNDPNNILFSSTTSSVFKSSDLGESWQLVYEHFPLATAFNVIKCGYDSIILVGGEKSYGMLRSVDNGDSWEIVLDLYSPLYYEHVTDILFGPDHIIYASTKFTNVWSDDQPKVYRSLDYGKTWENFLTSLPVDYSSLAIDNYGRLLVGATGGIFRHDFDQGTWEHIALNANVTDILVVPDDRVFLACSAGGTGWGGVVASLDGGDTYTTICNTGLINGNAKQFETDMSGKLLMIQGGTPYVYRSNDTILTSAHFPELLNQQQLSCFPNPFTDFITFKSTSEKTLNIQLFNSQGINVYEIEILPFQVIQINLDFLLSGIYFTLTSNGIHQTSLKLIRN